MSAGPTGERSTLRWAATGSPSVGLLMPRLRLGLDVPYPAVTALPPHPPHTENTVRVTIVASPIDPVPGTFFEYWALYSRRTDTVSIQSRYIGRTKVTTEARCSYAELTQHLANRGHSLETATQDDLSQIAMGIRIFNRLRDSGLYTAQLGPSRRRRQQRQPKPEER